MSQSDWSGEPQPWYRCDHCEERHAPDYRCPELRCFLHIYGKRAEGVEPCRATLRGQSGD